MVLTSTGLERIATWCDTSAELEFPRRAAWDTFFGTGEGSPGDDYRPELGDLSSRHRRFLGWFMFQATLPDGRHPAEAAVHSLFEGAEQTGAARAVAHARYVMAVVSAVLPGRGANLEIEDERFEVRSRSWARLMRRDAAVFAHLVPVRSGVWLPGPGWFEWPVAVGPNMRHELRKYQPDPVAVERVLQGRSRSNVSDIERPTDVSLAAAVARMTGAANRVGRTGLVRSQAEWAALVLRHLDAADITAFAREVITWAGDVDDVQELNQWMALAQNIWNNTPQPNRGGRTAYELAAQSSPEDQSIESWHS